MRVSRLVRPRSLVLLLLLAIIAMAGFGFAATNTVPGSAAGDGSGSISGYTVSAITYTLDSTDPSLVNAVNFSIAGVTKPVTVKAQLVPAGTWYTCVVGVGSGPWAVTCATTSPAVTAVAATNLRVVAAQ